MPNAEVIIVGGGVIGCATAYYLAKAGLYPVVLEKKEIGAGASSRNGGGVRQSARDLREMPLAIHAVRHLWPALSEELGVDVEYHRQGNLRLGKTGEHLRFLERMVAQSRSAGLELSMVDGAEVREICPYLSGEVIGASYCPTDGHGNPMKTTLGFYKRAREFGARFITGATVLTLRTRRGRIAGVETDRGFYEAPQVLLAAGLGSRPIANTVGIDPPLQKVLLEALVTEAYPRLFPQMLGTAAADFYGHQTDHGSFVFGGSTGLEPFASEVPSPVTRSMTAPSLCRAILSYFPMMRQVNIIRTWSGFIDETADHVPVLGKVEEVPGLALACGFSGHGYGISPAVGQLMAEVLTAGEPSLPLDAFRYDRFQPKS